MMDDLYRTHSGPPPRAALSAALLGGVAIRDFHQIAAAQRVFRRLAADARFGISRRRKDCGASPQTDGWLGRLTGDLTLYRNAAESWRRLAAARPGSEAHSIPSAIL
ncbi:hypothetical protein N825_17845 [Skermanella stibiiresistens SB22]|uniref:Uncharacterized protein n=1 Tax=Skermanella stibiiresistens SB22 TaxID=1385369 RepID=W9GUJ7_9PROT|nr:hypothetical protein [Skermanella stibiiresistens]EWY37474.1 hypothetical protein N825_17845 [Skermanella stibiiresistens SB22]